MARIHYLLPRYSRGLSWPERAANRRVDTLLRTLRRRSARRARMARRYHPDRST